MNIVCIGSGYVGSITAAAFALLGHSVTIIDIDEQKVNDIAAGKSPIYEPGLNEIISKTVGKSLFATTDYSVASKADIIFICVGTPSKPDLTADLTYVKSAAAQIGKNMISGSYTIIVDKSTVPVGTSDLVGSIIEEMSGLRQEVDFDVVSNPEFLREGFAVEDVFFPDRIVIGVSNHQSSVKMNELYEGILSRKNYHTIYPYIPSEKMKSPLPIWLQTDTKSAELIKYASNAFLAVKISFINEMARLCDTLGANVAEVSKGMGLDSRIGGKFLEVSSGWSGSCFPKDTAELLATAGNYGCNLPVVQSAVDSNLQMHEYCVQKLQNHLLTLQGKTIGILGLTFKPNTDDARSTQAGVIIKKLLDLGARVKVHDPQGVEMFQKINPDLQIQYCHEPEDVALMANAVVLLTHWNSYLQMDWDHIKKLMKHPYVLDTRNVLSKEELTQIGFKYDGLGISNSR